MGHYNIGTIRYFQPDDTDTCMYIEANYQEHSLESILEKAKAKWPDASLSNLSIGAEHIHTDCLGYDLYDASDYRTFITVNYEPE